jgi:zinc transporter 1/2/3
LQIPDYNSNPAIIVLASNLLLASAFQHVMAGRVVALRVVALALLAQPCAPFEWAGLFETPQSSYMWVSQAAGGAYAAPGMKMVLFPAATASKEEMLRLRANAETKFAVSVAEGGFGQCREVAPGGTITPKADVCYNLRFHKNTLDSIFVMNTTGQGHVAIFTSHLPTEFERTEHFFKDAAGDDVDPLHELAAEVGGDGHAHGGGSGDGGDGSETLTLRIVAVFASGGITLLGMFFFFTKQGKALSLGALLCVRACSAGAMISVAIVHILAEAAHSIAAWTPYPLSAALVLGGIVLAYCFEVLSGGDGCKNESKHDHVDVDNAPPAVQPSVIIAGAAHGASFGAQPPAVDVESEEAHQGFITSSRIAVESMEVGCVVHSIILGIALGMQTQARTASVLLAVFLVHQLLEALSLGHLIASLQQRTEAMVMISLTAASMPVGIVIGIVILHTIKGTPEHLNAITAAIACIAGGMLLYSSLVNIIAEDVKRPVRRPPSSPPAPSYLLAAPGAFPCLVASSPHSSEPADFEVKRGAPLGHVRGLVHGRCRHVVTCSRRALRGRRGRPRASLISGRSRAWLIPGRV